MSSTKISILSLLIFFSAACSVFEPFVDRRRNAGETDLNKLYVGRSKKDAPAVCSNNLWTDEEKIQALADKECIKYGTGTHAVLTNTTHFTCRLLLPTHTYFKCEK